MIRRVAEMSEVQVDTRLTNMSDWELARKAKLPESDMRSVICQAVVDTGAVMSVVPQNVVDSLGLEVARSATVRMAGGASEKVGVVHGLLVSILDRETEENACVMGDEVLIGQTVLEKLDLLVDCANQRVIGNPEHPDGPLLRV